MLTQSYLFLKDKVDYLRYRSSTPRSPKGSDLYIVEYPKSGITWFSSIMASCFLQQAGTAIRPSHYNMEQLVCDVHINRDIADNSNFPYYRLIKSHACYNPFYRHVVYMIRNPFSVMNSYYNFMRARNMFHQDLKSFIQSDNYGVNSWVRHVESWLNPEKEMKLHLLRYEDLKDNAQSVIQTLFENLGLLVSDEIISKALTECSFDNMRKSNDLYRQHAPMRNYDFVREGKRDANLDAETRDYIARHARPVLEKHYPEYL